jgi:TolB protein
MRRMKNIVLFFLVVLGTVFSYPDKGKGIIYIDINSPQIRRFYLAFPTIKDLGELPQGIKEEVEKTLAQDLTISDLFYVMERVKLPQQEVYITEDTVDFGAWKNSGAEFVLSVGCKGERDAVSIEFRLFDAIQSVYVAGKRYRGSPGEIQVMLRKLADEVVQQLTGERGIFQTKIAFVTDRTGNKEIALIDVNGRTETMITHNGSINISPDWHPDGRSLLYTCFQRRNPDLYQVFLSTGSSLLLSAVPGPNATPAWSPDGRRIALMMRGENNTEIYLLNQQGKDPSLLTRSWDNKASPAWSPDGKQIAFVSDRSGSPQIYILDLATRKLRRLTYEGGYNCSPAWSPKGDRIAFARQEEGRFHIYLIRPDGTDARRLTKEGNNENPSWAPNGRHLVFASKIGGSYDIYIMTADGGGPWKLTASESNETEPAWSPWLQ